MKKILFALLAVTLIMSSCSEDSNPENGEIYFQLDFAKEVDDPDATVSIITFGFDGGLYTVNSGRFLKTDSYFVQKNDNVNYALDGSNHWGCIPTTLRAFYRGREIFKKEYQVGIKCEGVQFDIDAIFSGNVIIP